MATHELTETERMLVSLALVDCEAKHAAAQHEFGERCAPILRAHGWATADFRNGIAGQLVAVTPEPSAEEAAS